MSNPLVSLCLLVNLVAFFLPGHARAEIAHGESIEWITADSERVFVGKVVKVELVTGEDKQEYEAATVAASKTLKGKHADKLTFLIQSYHGPVAKDWLADGLPMLLFLVCSDRLGMKSGLARRFEWVLREDGNDPSAVLLAKSDRYWTHTIKVFTREFSVLTEPEKILKRVENAAAAFPKQTKRHAVRVPGKTGVYEELYARSAVYLSVPVDEELEALGRKWCQSTSYFDRTAGVKILRHFKNDKNTQILKPLLKDQHSSEETLHRTVSGQHVLALVYRKRVFEVRRLAYEALREFGVQVEKPVLEELLEGKDSEG